MGLAEVQHNVHADVLLVEDKGLVWGRVRHDISRLDIVLADTSCHGCVVCSRLPTWVVVWDMSAQNFVYSLTDRELILLFLVINEKFEIIDRLDDRAVV